MVVQFGAYAIDIDKPIAVHGSDGSTTVGLVADIEIIPEVGGDRPSITVDEGGIFSRFFEDDIASIESID